MRKIIFALAFGALLLPDYGLTLGLGEIEVTTALNQELNAEIELLSAAPEDVETLIVKLASREEFARAGIDRPYLLNNLKFSAEIRKGVPIIRVTSDKPIREPFLNFLVEIDWPKGHMMREYTILLDPPVFMEQQPPVQQELSRPAAMESARPASTSGMPSDSGSAYRPSVMPAPAVTAAPAPSGPSEQSTGSYQPAMTQTTPTYTRSYQPPAGYRIQKGDTLWSLADEMRPDQSISIEQMMMALLRSNPEAFIKENVNGLKSGYILRIPDRDDIASLSRADAIAVVREQNALWREYKQSVAGGSPTSAIEQDTASGAGMAVEDSGKARLEIVAVGTGTSAAGAKDPTEMSASELRAELAITRESLETERLEKEELQQRVAALEGQVDRMKSLLTLEDADMAEMQQAATSVESEAMPELGAVEEAIVEEPQELVVDEAGLDEVAALEDIAGEDTALTEDIVDEGAVEDAEEALFLDEDTVADETTEFAEEVVEQPAAAAEEFAVAPPVESAVLQPKKQDPISMLLNNPMLLAAAGGGLLLILLLIALIMKRRKASSTEEPMVASNLDDIDTALEEGDLVQVAEDEALQQAAATVAEESEPVDRTIAAEAAEPSPGATAATQPEADAAESRDDIIAEADVYLAYGIYQQAEELLRNALKEHPDKDSYRVKLAETYLASKNSDGFIELATDMNQRRNGENTPAWQKITEIGRQLVPGHAVFADAAEGNPGVDDTMTQTAELGAVDTDAEPKPAEDMAPDLDLNFDEPEAASESLDEAAETVTSVEFDLDETGAEAERAEAAAAPQEVEFDLTETQAMDTTETTGEFSLDIEASELGIDEEAETETGSDEFDLDLSSDIDALTADDEPEESEVSLDDIADEVLDFDEAAKESEEVVEAASADETDIDLAVSLEEATEPEEAAEEATILDFSDAAASSAESLDDELDLSELDDIDEVSTKLDLAKAYLDMGDADGTRSILDEVMSEGNDEQKKEADELLRQLG